MRLEYGMAQMGIELSYSTTNTSGIVASANTSGNLEFRTNVGATAKMFITNAGNVGIGTTSPSQKLEVIGRTKITQSGDALRINSADANGPYVTWQNNGSAIGYIGAGYHLWSSPNNIATSLGIRANTRLDLGIQANVHMTILSSGDVGIGTTSPTTKFQVAGNSTYISVKNTSNYRAVDLGADSSGDGQIIMRDGSNNNKILFYAEANADNYINNGGNFGIGTAFPTGKLEIQRSQITTQFDRDSFLRLHPTTTTNSGGFTNIFFGTSPVNNYGIAIGGLRAGADGTPSFSVRALDDSITGIEVLNIGSTGAIKFNAYGAGTLVTDASGNITVSSGGGAGGPFLPLSAGSTKKLTDTLYIQGTNTTNAESV